MGMFSAWIEQQVNARCMKDSSDGWFSSHMAGAGQAIILTPRLTIKKIKAPVAIYAVASALFGCWGPRAAS